MLTRDPSVLTDLFFRPHLLHTGQLNTEFKVAVTVASKGANMHIPDTGVELDIPTGATQGKVLIEMIILPFDKLDAPVSTFSSNSSVAVELLPNKMEFQRPVRLTLPHCLKLTKNYQKTKHQVQVYVSYHETGKHIKHISRAFLSNRKIGCISYYVRLELFLCREWPNEIYFISLHVNGDSKLRPSEIYSLLFIEVLFGQNIHSRQTRNALISTCIG